MDLNTTIDIILKDLREVREIVDDLKNYPGVPLLQVELAKSKCRSAEEVIALLKTLKPAAAAVPGSVQQAENQVSESEPPLAAPKKPEMAHVIKEAREPAKSDVHTETVKENLAAESVKKSETPIIADKFSASQATILDQFGNAGKEDAIGTAIKGRHVENLSDAIGINDRFLFIREIFSGNTRSYEEAMGRIEKARSLSDAKAIIMSYPGVSEKSEEVRMLLEIIKRKLPSDG